MIVQQIFRTFDLHQNIDYITTHKQLVDPVTHLKKFEIHDQMLVHYTQKGHLTRPNDLGKNVDIRA